MYFDQFFAPRMSMTTRRATVLASTAAMVVTIAVGTVSADNAHASTGLLMSSLKTAKYGTILESTRTVYTLVPSKVACTAKCLSIWPEVLLPKGSTKAVAGRGVNATKLGTVKRAGGRLQVTYAGKALYYFAFDRATGQVKGNVKDTWGKWMDVTLVKSTTTTTAAGGSGAIGF